MVQSELQNFLNAYDHLREDHDDLCWFIKKIKLIIIIKLILSGKN